MMRVVHLIRMAAEGMIFLYDNLRRDEIYFYVFIRPRHILVGGAILLLKARLWISEVAGLMRNRQINGAISATVEVYMLRETIRLACQWQ